MYSIPKGPQPSIMRASITTSNVLDYFFQEVQTSTLLIIMEVLAFTKQPTIIAK